jgi:FAD/FMN-containing dehydrogenase/Fe-S oxidoreductase
LTREPTQVLARSKTELQPQFPFSAAEKRKIQSVANSISKIVKGDVLWDDWQRVMYATDASPYEILPLCVVIPKSAEDVANVVRYAHEQGIAIIPRGGGSGLVGGALGSGIVLDFSKYMKHVISIGEDHVICEPGIFKDNLESAIEEKRLFLPVSPSSSAYCCIGGMIGNNASGARSLKYGHTIDYLEAVDLVVYDGTIVTLNEVSVDSQEWREIRNAGNSTQRSRIYNQLFDLVSSNLGTIKNSMPKVSKNSAGYRLDLAYDEKKGTFNPSKVICGSEGTFGIVVRAKFRLIKKPKKRGLLILRYDSFKAMGDAIPSITNHHPSATELMDKSVIEAASLLNPEVKRLNKDKLIALIVEFDGDDENEILEKLKKLQQEISKENKNESEVVIEEKEIERIWALREQSLGFAYKVREGEKRTEAVIEDTVVPPEKLGEFLGKLMDLYKEMGFDQMSWGHVSEGNIHTRPFVNYKSAEDLEKAKKLADRVYSLVSSYQGSTTGEHSDGILRAPYIKTIYNEEMIKIFKQAKQIFDPSGLMNPKKKVDSLDESPLRNLRYGPSYATKPSAATYVMNWGTESSRVIKSITGRETALDFEHEAESCFGCGRCREQSKRARMCPVYDAEYEEVSACRGRNNLLRWMNKIGGLASDFATTKEYGRAIYENCIQCKMCLVDCPANTDVGKLMAEARARYAKIKGAPKGYNFFFEIDKYANYNCAIAPISNWAMRNSIVRYLIEKVAGIDRRKNFPPFHRKRFVQRFYEEHPEITADQVKNLNSPEKFEYVTFFYDTYLNYNAPELGMRIVRLFEKNGLKVIVPRQKSSGMPAIIEGAPQKGRKYAEYNISNLAPYAAKGVPIVTFSPSAGLTLKNDYLDVYDTSESRLVSQSTMDIHEFLCKLNKSRQLRRELMQPIKMKCLVHFHCHSIVQQVEDYVKEALSYVPDLEFDILENGCCGNGGTYSFIAGNFPKTLKMGRGLIRDIQNSPIPVYSTGESCKVQLEQGSMKTVGLTSELLCQSFGD